MIYLSLLHSEFASYFNMKLLSYSLNFRTHIRTPQTDSRRPSYDLQEGVNSYLFRKYNTKLK